jgi:DNA-binding PadR family transcriptional regulator
MENELGLETTEYWEGQIRKSISRYMLLAMLARRPMHGYEIASEIEQCCEGWCRPTDGTVYPTLKELEKRGYVECASEVVEGRVRRVCSLTTRGEEAFRAASRVWGEVIPMLQSCSEQGISGQVCCPGSEPTRSAPEYTYWQYIKHPVEK